MAYNRINTVVFCFDVSSRTIEFHGKMCSNQTPGYGSNKEGMGNIFSECPPPLEMILNQFLNHLNYLSSPEDSNSRNHNHHSPEVEDSRVHVFKAVVIADNSEEKFCILSKIGRSGKQPTVAKFALLNIESRVTFNEELRIVTNLHRSQPFVTAIWTT